MQTPDAPAQHPASHPIYCLQNIPPSRGKDFVTEFMTLLLALDLSFSFPHLFHMVASALLQLKPNSAGCRGPFFPTQGPFLLKDDLDQALQLCTIGVQREQIFQ